MTDQCAEVLKQTALRDGTDITVSTAPPLVPSRYGAHAFTCPHGIKYWIEPTGEQIAQWVKDGTP